MSFNLESQKVCDCRFYNSDSINEDFKFSETIHVTTLNFQKLRVKNGKIILQKKPTETRLQLCNP